MATITPGYDFTATEIPLFATMMKAALGLNITDLSGDDIEVALVSILVGNTSGASGATLPDQAWMWADPSGQLWIETKWTHETAPTEEYLQVPLIKRDGGWMSGRYRVGDIAVGGSPSYQGENAFTNDGFPFNEKDVFLEIGAVNFNQDGGRGLGVTWDSPVSGSRVLLVGYGPVEIYFAAQTDPQGRAGSNKMFSTGAGWVFGDIGTDAGVRPNRACMLGPGEGAGFSSPNWQNRFKMFFKPGPVWGP
jgi:hypothetical protein